LIHLVPFFELPLITSNVFCC